MKTVLSFEAASIERAYARVRELPDLANRAHAVQPAPARRAVKSRAPRHRTR